MPRIGIYKLSNRHRADRTYIGSSHNIDKRFYKHKWTATRSKRDGHIPLYVAMREDGPENYDCELLEDLEHSDCDKAMMRRQEQHYIALLKPTLNCRNAFLTAEQAAILRRSYWTARNKRSQECECGCVIKKACFARHLRSVKHRRIMIEKLMAELRALFSTFGVGLGAVWCCGGNVADTAA